MGQPPHLRLQGDRHLAQQLLHGRYEKKPVEVRRVEMSFNSKFANFGHFDHGICQKDYLKQNQYST